jgi:hypothetical protein
MSLSHDEAERLKAIEQALSLDDPVLTYALRRHQPPRRDPLAPVAAVLAALCAVGIIALLPVSVLASFACAVAASGLVALADARSHGRWRTRLGARLVRRFRPAA